MMLPLKSTFHCVTSIIFASLLVHSGCTTGDGEAIAGIDGGDDPRTFTVVGTLNGFGSVIVNGVRYDTSQATFIVNGETATEDQLAVGQVVSIVGTIDPDTLVGFADTVSFDEIVQGEISGIDLVSNQFQVLGQTVLVDGNTSFGAGIRASALMGLQIGDSVEVSGYLDASGLITASRVDLDDSNTLELTGVVDSVDTTSMLLTINQLIVDYSSATLDGFGGDPAIDDRVEVRGLSLAPAGELIASVLMLESGILSGPEGSEANLEGFVTRFVSESDFGVSGQAVTTNQGTEFENGVASDLVLNARVEIQGEIDNTGSVLANQVKFILEGNVMIHAPIDSLDSANQLVQVAGINVEINAATRLEDKIQELRPFTFDDLAVSDFIKLSGFEGGSGSAAVVATLLERVGPEDKSKVKAVVQSVSDPEFTIVGLTVLTDAQTQFEADGMTITAVEFFSIANGRLVEVEGSLVGNNFLAQEVELED